VQRGRREPDRDERDHERRDREHRGLGQVLRHDPVLARADRLAQPDLARAARGLDDLGRAPLEGVMVVSAFVALALFGVWFFFLSGAEPVPLGLPR